MRRWPTRSRSATRELAIRLALGADPGRLVRRVLAEELRVAIVGGVIGVLVARAGGRMLRSLVYSIQTTDPASVARRSDRAGSGRHRRDVDPGTSRERHRSGHRIEGGLIASSPRSMDDITIVETAEQHINGFHRCVGLVARERKYIALVDSPPIESTRAFVRSVIEGHGAHFVALDADGEVVGWCDIARPPLDGFRHCGRLGMGLLPHVQGRGVGRRLAEVAIDAARARAASSASSSRCSRATRGRSASTSGSASCTRVCGIARARSTVRTTTT
jgi:GNAT superfamily N-acetyltransferase